MTVFGRIVIVVWVLSEYRVASLTLLLDNGLSVHQKLSHHLAGVRDLLLQVCYSSDHKRSLPLARLLLERGADIAIKDDCSETKLHAAACRGNSSIAALLLEHGANVNVTDEHGRTPLHWACFRDSFLVTKILLENGAEVNATDMYGEIPLQCADESFTVYRSVVQLLLDNGADVNPISELGCSPVQTAVSI
jgi:ankyrin repeat protein